LRLVMKNLDEIKSLLERHKETISKRFGVEKIGIFGSYSRGEQKECSDVDIVVEFKVGEKTFDNYMDLKFYLEDILESEVDLVVESSIKSSIKPCVMEEAVYVSKLPEIEEGVRHLLRNA